MLRILIVIAGLLLHSLPVLSKVVFEAEPAKKLKSDLVKYQSAKSEILFLKNLYSKNDTTVTAGILLHDSTFINLVNSLDKNNPVGFYQQSAMFLGNFKIDEAAFLLNLGRLRFKYYNETNPGYTASGDGALSMSLFYSIAEPIGRYVKVNIDNYIEVLNACIEWHSNHAYKFVTENNDAIKYNRLTNDLIAMRDKYAANRLTLKKEAKEESDQFMKNSADMLQSVELKISELNKELKQLK